MYCIHAINQNKIVSRSPFGGIPERVIDIDDRFISVMNDKEGDIFFVYLHVPYLLIAQKQRQILQLSLTPQVQHRLQHKVATI